MRTQKNLYMNRLRLDATDFSGVPLLMVKEPIGVQFGL